MQFNGTVTETTRIYSTGCFIKKAKNKGSQFLSKNAIKKCVWISEAFFKKHPVVYSWVFSFGKETIFQVWDRKSETINKHGIDMVAGMIWYGYSCITV